MKTYPFSKIYHLRKKSEFRKVYDEGRVVRSQLFSLFYKTREEDKPARLGITVTRSFGGAVRRNRMKRLVREVFRLERPILNCGVDIVINARTATGTLSFQEVYADIASLLAKAVFRPS